MAKSDVDSQESETTATEGFRRRFRLTQDRILAVLLTAAAAAFLVIRLGASLIGHKVFLGLDLFYLFAPWSASPDSHPVMTSIYVSDQLDATIPALHEVAQRFLHGDIASWSPLVGGGSPLLSQPDYALISPGRWLFVILPTWLAPSWSKLLEIAFAATFTYLLGRRLKLSKISSGLAGFIYPLTGFMISWTNWQHVAVGSVIPMLFWAIERFTQERAIRAAIPVSVAVGLLLFGGFPAVAGQALYLGGGYAVVRVIAEQRSRFTALARDIVVLSTALGVGIGLAAVQLLPFAHSVLENVDLSYREGGFFTHTQFRYLMTSVFPESFAGNHLWVGASPMDLNIYVGSVVVFLCALGLFHALTGRIRGVAGLYFFFMIVFIVGLLWFQGPWSNWMDQLPVFHGNPIDRIRSQLGLPVAILAAAGFDFLRGIEPSPGWSHRFASATRWPAVVVGLGVCLAVVYVGIKISDGPFAGLSNKRGEDALIAGVPLVVIAALLVAGLRAKVARPIALAAILISISAQAVAATAFYWPTADRSEFYPSTSAIKFLQKNLGHDRIATSGYVLRPNISSYYDLRVLNGHAFFSPNMKSVITGIDRGAFVGATYSIFSPRVESVINSPGLSRMGVHYLVSEANAVSPSQPNSALPIAGVADLMPPSAGSKDLDAGIRYQVKIGAGAVRAVNIPLKVTSPVLVSVALKDAHGTTIAQNSRRIGAGSATLPVPLAADPAGSQSAPSSSGALTVEVSANAAGSVATSDATGQLRIQAVRPPAGDRIRVAYAGENLVVWERFDYVSRIHWASQATVIADDDARLKAVTSSALRPGGVILQDKPPVGLSDASGTASKFDIVEDSGDTIRVRVQTANPGYVVVTDNIQTEFDATVDGHDAPIVAADYAGGAVYVGAGSHEIAIKYAPAGRRTGTMISAASGGVLCLVAIPTAWWGRLQRRSRTPQ